MLNYTFSKELDDLAGVRKPGADYLEYGPGTIDHANVASATFVYKLPFGAGHSINPGNLVGRGLVSDWQVSGLYTFSSGAPLTITGTCTGGGIIDASCYPNYTPGFAGSAWSSGVAAPTTAAVASTTHYLNKAAFTDAPVYTYGNVARTAPDGLFAPKVQEVDLNVRREFPIHEAVRFSLQGDVFNVSNSVYFSAPNTTLDSTSYGYLTAQANQPRKWQFSARLSF
jgi:hypothetical protein